MAASTSLSHWESMLQRLLPLANEELTQVIEYARRLPSDDDAFSYLLELVGDSPSALQFIRDFVAQRRQGQPAPKAKSANRGDKEPPPYSAAESSLMFSGNPKHSNPVITAGHHRAKKEQDMLQTLQDLQFKYRIYNPELEPEHDSEGFCNCPVHNFQGLKMQRVGVQHLWSKAVMYPGEHSYAAVGQALPSFHASPYVQRCGTPFDPVAKNYFRLDDRHVLRISKPSPKNHETWTTATIALSNRLNREAQESVDANEPKECIWTAGRPDAEAGPSRASTQNTPNGKSAMADMEKDMHNMGLSTKAAESKKGLHGANPATKDGAASWDGCSDGKSIPNLILPPEPTPAKDSKFSSFRRTFGIRSSSEKAAESMAALRAEILSEEAGRWAGAGTLQIVAAYQEKIGLARQIADLRMHKPIQYLHLLRGGYFEPIPVDWANHPSNPLKFIVDAREGWRGITPAWRGYEDLAEERLYWVLNHRDGGAKSGSRCMKPDVIAEMRMARARMSAAVEPPPMYYSPDDLCQTQHTAKSEMAHGYSKQVMPGPLHLADRPELPTDDTMILLDVSGSMDFEPVRPVYDRYLVTSYAYTNQPKNKGVIACPDDVAKAIVGRFVDALVHHDHRSAVEPGYDMVTFANRATYVGAVTRRNLDTLWASGVHLGGGTRVMTGWQTVKQRHFVKHRASAVHHPVYGWQAGPETPMLRLLLLLDGEAADMDEFELDLLGLSWAHVTIFLIGADNCPHHHRHANELQRISAVNPHVSFVDAQGNCPERFVTHELLKRHLGYDMSLREFEEMEQLPAYTE